MPDPSELSDERLEDLVFEALELRARGGSADMEAFVASQGAYAEALRAELERLAGSGLLDAEDEPAPPERLGDFRLLERLGRGGMGVVYAAEQVSLRRRVALKLLLPELLAVPMARRRFRREVEAVARLQHPGILPIHAFGTEGGVPFLAMERFDGCTLADVLEELEGRDPSRLVAADLARALEERALPGPQPRGAAFEGPWIEAVLRIARDVAEALEHAHSRGLVHRDVKPSNVALTRGGRALLFDFGLVLDREGDERLTRSGAAAGTLHSMSPEQIEGRRDLDGRSDVWSLGVLLYQMLTLRRPFDGTTEQELRAQVLAAAVVRPRALHRRLPHDVETVVLKALERRRERRYATAGDFARDLANLLAHRPVEARAPGSALRLLRWSQRNPRRSAALAAGLPLAFAGLSAVAWLEAAGRREQSKLRAAADQSAQRARDGEREALRLAAIAEAERRRVLRLADERRLRELRARVDGLYPPDAARLGEIDAWLEEARRLVERASSHESDLQELTDAVEAASVEEAWHRGALQELLDELAAFERPGGALAQVRELRELAQRIGEESLHGAEARRLWDEARASIADPARCPQYAGLALAPQLGLLPLGRDPASGLWEFAHLASGTPARRDGDGRVRLAEGDGVVLVLIPGGAFAMGAQAKDPAGSIHDPEAGDLEAPVHGVLLAPYFIAKHELTQDQWLRWTGTNPSAYQAPATRRVCLLNPVEQISWHEAVKTLRRLGLALPTEAQWEYAARAGTTTPWWTGANKESLAGAANLADAFCRANGGPASWSYEDWLDDGFAVHAPVGSFRANAFGLHDVLGNVWEWVADAAWEYGAEPGGDQADGEPQARGARGGCLSSVARVARVSSRQFGPLDTRDSTVGARPARAVDP